MTREELEAKLKNLEKLEARIKNLEDIEEIKKLQRAYSYYLEHYEGQQVVELFSDRPDVSVDIGKGVYKGQAGIKQFFLLGKMPPEFLHVLMPISGIVDVDTDGKTAKGRWYGFGCYAFPSGGKIQALLASGIWENEYVKEGGKWKLKKIYFSRTFTTPYEDGWVKTPMTKIPFDFRPKDEPKPDPSPFNKPYPSGAIFPYHYKNPVSAK